MRQRRGWRGWWSGRPRRARRVGMAAVALIVAAAAVLWTAPWSAAAHAGRRGAVRVGTPAPPDPLATPVTAPAPAPAPALVPWQGPVEHIFFHTLVIRPDLALTHDQLAQGFRDWFVTVGEFRSILDQLYANGWTLVDIHRAVDGTVMVPPGRKPLVLSEDDVNYYDYSRPRGLGWRLVLDAAGDVKVEVRDNLGVRITDEDLIPLVDEFVAAHPDFSADGAKGVIAVTGYEGVFGERTEDPTSPDWAASVARATAIAQRLKATGWTLASHSYGHIDLTRDSTAVAARDTARWQAEVEPITGPTDVYVYPFGAAPIPGSPTFLMLRGAGFTIQCDIDDVPRLITADGVSVMSRRHIDGIAFRDQVRNLAPFFSVASVEDTHARG
ncbi:MAG TPA: polysaccharide deacetylase family protein [Acidimicrobiales bacterium]|nr:polysaccharide deacetylase family protein [Acidimicrobiales bacterium]